MQKAAVEAMEMNFQHIPDKKQAWEVLHRIVSEENLCPRMSAARMLGNFFQDIPDKQQAWEDLVRLTSDSEILVRIEADHSLGKASIYKASISQSPEEYMNELENAIIFFDRGPKKESCYNPSIFDLPYYRSLYAIISKGTPPVEAGIDEGLARAKKELRKLENGKLLLEILENFEMALREVRNLENTCTEAGKNNPEAYGKYLEQALKLMEQTEKTKPYETETLRKGLPILKAKLENL